MDDEGIIRLYWDRDETAIPALQEQEKYIRENYTGEQ